MSFESSSPCFSTNQDAAIESVKVMVEEPPIDAVSVEGLVKESPSPSVSFEEDMMMVWWRSEGACRPERNYRGNERLLDDERRGLSSRGRVRAARASLFDEQRRRIEKSRRAW